MSYQPLTRAKLNGEEPEKGGFGVKLTYNHLKKELIKAGVMKEEQEIAQVDVHDDGVVLLFNTENVDLIGGEIND